jgi:crotonobetainyl-CoA:carnitine CoA-transferase CaiB-like acyl-CoA transferase
VTPTSDHDFAGMCRALGVEGYDDPRVATIVERFKHKDVLAPLMESCYANATSLTSAAASERFDAEDVPYAMILSPDELTRDPHALAVGLFEYQSHDVVGRVRLPRHPAQFASTPASLAGGSPTLGEHTDEILAGLGLSDRIEALRSAGVVQ